jgi:hypothetical protein
MYKGPGRYRHYKGMEYEVIGRAEREATKHLKRPIIDVIYKPASAQGKECRGDFWSRRLEVFNDDVGPLTHGDEARGFVPRFEKVEVKVINPGYHETCFVCKTDVSTADPNGVVEVIRKGTEGPSKLIHRVCVGDWLNDPSSEWEIL